MTGKQLVCKQCGQEREVGRRLCRPCNLQRLIEIVNSRPRYTYTNVCEACKEEYPAWRKKQIFCKACYEFMQAEKATRKVSNNYIFTKKPGRTEHRDLVELLLGKKLGYHEVVHHVDTDPTNNELTNLMVMTRTIHGRLHQFLDLQRVILEKSNIENFENCWKILIVPLTTAWLETTSAKVIKIWEIGQSAAEPLMVETNEEGSETMHETPNHLVEGDDIVQTTKELVLASES